MISPHSTIEPEELKDRREYNINNTCEAEESWRYIEVPLGVTNGWGFQ